MLNMVTRDWWMFGVRGVAAIIFGVLAIAWPNATIGVLVMLFGAFALVDGIALLGSLVSGDPLARRHAWSVGIMGAFGILVGVVTFFYPGITALSLLYIVAFWAIVTGVLQVVAAIEFRKVIDGEFWMALGGVISVAFGILLIAQPGTGLLALVWLVSIYAIAFGLSSLGLAYRLRGVNQTLQQHKLAI